MQYCTGVCVCLGRRERLDQCYCAGEVDIRMGQGRFRYTVKDRFVRAGDE